MPKGPGGENRPGDVIGAAIIVTKPRYILRDLIEQCDADAPVHQEDQDWFADGRKGAEKL